MHVWYVTFRCVQQHLYVEGQRYNTAAGICQTAEAANYLEVFDKIPGKPSGSKGCIDALSGEIVQLLEVGIHHNLLLIGVLEGLHPWQLTILTCSQ